MRKIAFYLLYSLLINSCTTERNDDNVLYGYETNELVLEKIDIEPLIGAPNKIRIIGDTLILADRVDGYGLLLYDLANNSYIRTLKIGNGPDDLIFPVCLDVDLKRHELAILQRGTGFIRVYSLTDLSMPNPLNKSNIRINGTDMFAWGENSYFIAGSDDEDIIWQSNYEGNKIGRVSYGIKNKIIEEKNGNARRITSPYSLLQGSLAYNEYSGVLMMAPSFASTIYFFKKNGNEWTESNSLSFGDDGFAERIARNDYSLDENDIQRTIDVCKTKNFFYVLYHGAPLGGSSNPTTKHILQFTKEGKLKHVFTTYQKIYSFCVKEDDSVLFAVIRDEDDEFLLAKARL